MKKLITLLLIIGIVVPSWGQNALEILNALNKKYTSFSSYSVGFTVSGSSKYAGNLLVKGKKYKATIAGQEVYNNGKEVYTYDPEINEVNITTYHEGDESDISPSNIFNLYKKGYKASYKQQKVIGGKKYDVVSLVPTSKSNIIKIEMTINKATNLIYSWSVFDKSGNTTFTITNFTSNIPMNDLVFSFDKTKYPRVEVVDLR